MSYDLPVHRLSRVAQAAQRTDGVTDKTLVTVQLGDLEAALAMCRTVGYLFFSDEWLEVRTAFRDFKGEVP